PVASLPPRESSELALSLTGTTAGLHCCRVVVTRRDAEKEIELASRKVCVDFVTRRVEIDVVAPTQRTEGSRAEFNIALSNRSLKTIHDVHAIVSFDKALFPKEASAEAAQSAGS